MAERGTRTTAVPPDDWPAHPDPVLELNGMGSFDWDLDSGLIYFDDRGSEILDMGPGRHEGVAFTMGVRLLPTEAARVDAVVAQALRSGADSYGAYFRVRCRDGTLRWTHTQGYIRRDPGGRPHRIHGILRDAAEELGDTVTAGEPDAPGGRDRVRALRRQTTGIVQRITAALARAHTVQDVIDILYDPHGLVKLGAARLVLGLMEGGGRIRMLAGAHVPDLELVRIEDPYPMCEVVRTLRPRFIQSPQDFSASYPYLWERLSGLGVSAAAYLPLIAQAAPVGAIGLIYRDRTGFSDEERNVLLALSSGIGQSLQRAVFFEQEQDLAAGLQQAMLPRTLPDIPGVQIAVRYRSAALGRDIGGDWYDVIPLPGGRVGAVIGDVQGHDTQAAAVMGQLRIVLRAYAAEGHTPAAVMARASAFLYEIDTERFATCLYAEADPSTGVVQLVRAGHLDPLLRQADGSCRRLPVEGGLPLGLSAAFERLTYPVGTVELDPGQTLLLCTDGLVERPGGDIDDDLRELAVLVASGPGELEDLADLLCSARIPADQVRGEDDVALLLRRRDAGAPQAAGRLTHRVAPGDPEALAGARHRVRAALSAWGARHRADEIELVTGELINNCLLHTEGAARVTLRMLTGGGRRLRVEVEDSSSALPRRRDAQESWLSGRGLLLVDELTDVWGVQARGSGKCVWGEFALPPP